MRAPTLFRGMLALIKTLEDGIMKVSLFSIVLGLVCLAAVSPIIVRAIDGLNQAAAVLNNLPH